MVRKAANDKATEDCAIARDYQRKKAERRKSWLRSVIKLQKKNPKIKPSIESPKFAKNKGKEEKLSPLKPQQLYFGSTSRISQVEAIQNLSTPS